MGKSIKIIKDLALADIFLYLMALFSKVTVVKDSKVATGDKYLV
jgi:hypothetical protein